MLLTHPAPGHSFHMVEHTALGIWQSYSIPPPLLHGGEGSSFPDSVPSNNTDNSESVVGITPVDSGMVMRHHIDELIAWSHFYPGFMGKMSTLTHFPLQPVCKDYFF